MILCKSASRQPRFLTASDFARPLVVKLPEAFAALPVLAQGVQAAAGNRGGNRSSDNNQNQSVGGGLGGGGNRGGVGGGGAFDIAAEETAKFKVDTVCLEHGKKEPNARVPYEVRPIEAFTSDANVQELCKMVGADNIDQRAAQAAAWHLANHMTWEQLVDKKVHHLLGGDEIYFTASEIRGAMQLTDRAMKADDARQQSANQTVKSSDTTAVSSGR